MKKIIMRIGILLLVFVAAAAGYFIWTRNKSMIREDQRVYTSIQESAFPVMYVETLGRKMNLQRGYSQDMREAVLRDSLTILPADRRLPVCFEDYEGTVTGIYYEIRSMDLERLVERTQVTEWETTEEGIRAILPIQNLLDKDEEYLLSISLTTEENGTIGYYTRIMWTDNAEAQSMVDLAENFSRNTFHYQQASDLTMYLEPDATEDNTSLGHASIHSSFSQITWGGLAMELAGDIQVTLKELDGIMGQIELKYMAARQAENGVTELYEVTDDFTLKWNEQRIYMMDFDREVNQIFTGARTLFNGKRILLGITNDDKVSAKQSPNGDRIAFVVNRDLWTYDQKDHNAVSVFSFRSQKNGGRGEDDRHDVKILQIDDEGNVDFLVYGYMTRGQREGQMGIGLYRYSARENGLEEKFFAPAVCSFEALKQDLDELCYLSPSGMLYLMRAQAVYGIDLNSSEYIVLADGLKEGGYAVSQDGRHLAWQDGHDMYQSASISLIDLETGARQTIAAPEGDYIRSLGFVGGDFLYGLAHQESRWVLNGRLEEIPMYALEILGEDSEILTRYEKEGYYIAGVAVEDSRIHLKRIVQSSQDIYTVVDEDTIVCNAKLDYDPMEGIGWYASSDRQKLYFVQLDSDIKTNHTISVSAPRKASYEESLILELEASAVDTGLTFYAYGNGHLTGITRDFAAAVGMAYDGMGVVTDQDQNILWNRVNRGSLRNIQDARNTAYRLTQHLEELTESKAFEDGVIGLDGRGLTLNQVLYFVDRGCPVVAYTGEGQYLLITGFDQFNVTLYHPETGESWKMGLNDAGKYFESLQNDFICGVFTQ